MMYCHLVDGRRILSCILLVLLFCFAVEAESAACQRPYGGTASPIPGTLEIENYDTGGEGVGYHDTTTGNNGGQYRTDDVDIWTSSDAGGYYIGANKTGEWLEYTVNVAATVQYVMEFWVCTPNSGRAMHIEQDGVDVSGAVNVPNTGSWHNWQTVSATANLTAGRHVLRVAFDAGGFDFSWIKFTEIGSSSDDQDADGLPDSWELQYGDLTTLTGRNGDNDGDGISNWIEYKLGTNPTSANGKGPGIYYQYDELGRIRKLERIPSQ